MCPRLLLNIPMQMMKRENLDGVESLDLCVGTRLLHARGIQ